MKQVMIFGSRGSLGSALAEVYRKSGEWRVHEVTREECDFTDLLSVREFLDEWLKKQSTLDHCVFCVGKLYAGNLEHLPYTAFQDGLAVNALSPLAVTHALQTKLKNPPKFIYLGSGASEVILPGLLPYSLAKGYLKEAVRALKIEEGQSFNYLWVWPGGIEGKFNDKAFLWGDYRPPLQRKAKPAGRVAQKIFDRATKSNCSTLNLSPLPLLVGRIQRIAPRLISWIFKLHQARR